MPEIQYDPTYVVCLKIEEAKEKLKELRDSVAEFHQLPQLADTPLDFMFFLDGIDQVLSVLHGIKRNPTRAYYLRKINDLIASGDIFKPPFCPSCKEYRKVHVFIRDEKKPFESYYFQCWACFRQSKQAKQPIKCLQCNKKIYLPPKVAAKQKFCSSACVSEYQKGKKRSERHL